MSEPLRGGCLCGGVRYEIRGSLARASHCHCSMCRKHHGSAFGSYAGVRRTEYAIVAGEELITRYRSSADVMRSFCSRCGSTLEWIRLDRPDGLSIALGTLDGDPVVRPSLHIHVASKAPWYEIADALPQRD